MNSYYDLITNIYMVSPSFRCNSAYCPHHSLKMPILRSGAAWSSLRQLEKATSNKQLLHIHIYNILFFFINISWLLQHSMFFFIAPGFETFTLYKPDTIQVQTIRKHYLNIFCKWIYIEIDGTCAAKIIFLSFLYLPESMIISSYKSIRFNQYN